MRIALPYDGSASARHAIDYVIGLGPVCDRRRIDVHLINVQEAILGIADSFGRDATDVASRLAASARETGLKLLTEPANLLEAAAVRAQSSVLIGDPANLIADYIHKNQCDAVVMGTRGLGHIGGLLLGSVASKIIHLVKVPVTLVK